MEKSESIAELAKALVKFHSLVGKIGKTSDNPFFKSKYADLAKILSEIDKPLHESGLAVIQLPCGENQLTTILTHESGEYISETYTMKPVKNDPQGVGSCITYMRRYAIGAILSLNIDKDDDANASSYVGNPIEEQKAKNNRLKSVRIMLGQAKTTEELKGIYNSCDDETRAEIYEEVVELGMKLLEK